MALITPLSRWQPAFRPFGRKGLAGRMLALTERCVKGPLFGCRMCGNCLLQETAFICHMECPKGIRNGPCGGVNNGKHRPEFFLGAAASPFAQDPSLQVIRDRKKINAGVQFFQTNLVFDPDRLDGWLENLEKQQLLEKVYILVGVSPLRTLNMAKYLNDRIPGITIPDHIMKRMEKAGADASGEGIRIAVETIRRLRTKPGISGVHIMPLGWEAVVPQIVNASF